MSDSILSALRGGDAAQALALADALLAESPGQAEAHYWRALALPYHATMDALGGDLYVRNATLEYHA